MVAPYLYGGRDIATAYYRNKDIVRLITQDNISIGDVIVASDADGEKTIVYIYAGKDQFIYVRSEEGVAEISIRDDLYKLERWPTLSEEQAVYMESGNQFYRALLDFQGIMLHASAVALDGKAYLFSGQSGIGKSTHTGLWQQTFGDKVKLFNDDKPALRRFDGEWYAYGTPWSGKHGININMKVPVAGICFLKRGDQNKIRRLSPTEALPQILSQTLRKFKDTERLSLMLDLVDKLMREVSVYELYNRPEPEAAQLSYETMRKGAKEENL
jgi:hypothetical protein